MNAIWVDEMISKAGLLLSKWRGGRVKVWEFTPTHRKLTLRIESSDLWGNLHIVCGECNYYCGPLTWQDSDFRVEKTVGARGGILLVDMENKFELRCDILSVEENVEPVYSPNLGIVSV